MTEVKINHLAVAVTNIQAALPFWRDALGLPVGDIEDVPAEQVQVAFLEAGEAHVELVQPTNEESGVAKHIAKKGPGLHHVCFEVEDIEVALQKMRDNGVRLINDEARERDGRRYAFVHPKSTGGVLVELYELAKA